MSTPIDARLFADFAAAPTPRERRSSRQFWRAAQLSLIERAAAGSPVCPVCSGDHTEQACPHGTAPELF